MAKLEFYPIEGRPVLEELRTEDVLSPQEVVNWFFSFTLTATRRYLDSDLCELALTFTPRNAGIIFDWMDEMDTRPLPYIAPIAPYWILHRSLTRASQRKIIRSRDIWERAQTNPDPQVRDFFTSVFDEEGVFVLSKLAAWNQRAIDAATLLTVSSDSSTYLFLLPRDLSRIAIPPYLWPY